MVAPLSGEERQAQGMVMDTAGVTSNLFKDQVTPAIGTGLNALDVANNQYVQDYAKAAIQPIFQELTETALPAVQAGANATGTVGSSRQGIAQAQAIERAARAAGQTTSGIFNQAYGAGLNALQSTLGQIPGLVSAYNQPAESVSAVGAQNRALEQARIDSDMAKHNYYQNLPYKKLTEYANLVTAPTGGVSETTVEGTPADKASQTLSLILGGASQIPGIVDWVRDIFKGKGNTNGLAPDF